ncbi:MAG: TraB/GumN family protein [Candidatus Jordarchaeum sp.]|uniref:TraB/GumN family protein n=1 Tax=Candidatus Jordarchaeum sp. TaxID=2823881 RepID=UPI00404A026E
MSELSDTEVPINFEKRKRESGYLPYVEFIGTAHFSKTSIMEVMERVQELRPDAVALELCPLRYYSLQRLCLNCPRRGSCDRKCEFIISTDHLVNKDTDIWLVDMDEREIHHRIIRNATNRDVRNWLSASRYVKSNEAQGLQLWEAGRKEEAMHIFDNNTEIMKRTFPSLWTVLIDQRNALMAARLHYIIQSYLDRGLKDFKILVVTGAAHVPGLKQMLRNPELAFDTIRRYGIRFTPPYRIRRVRVD